MRLSRILPVLLVNLVATPAAADIRDVAVAATGDRARVVIALEAAPSAASAAPIADGFVIDLTGAGVSARVWEPYDTRLVRRIEANARDGGAAIAVFTMTEVLAARARIEGTSVIVDVMLASSVGTIGGETGRLANAAQSGGDETADAGAPAVVAEAEPATAASDSSSDDQPTTHASAAGAAEGAEGTDEPAGGASFGGPAIIAPGAADVADPSAEESAAAPAEPGETAMLLAAHLDDDACAAAEEGVRADPWDLATLGDYGACLARTGHVAEAREIFERLATFAPEDPGVSLGLGALAQDAGDRVGAREHYEAALAHSDSDAEAARTRAFMATLGDH